MMLKKHQAISNMLLVNLSAAIWDFLWKNVNMNQKNTKNDLITFILGSLPHFCQFLEYLIEGSLSQKNFRSLGSVLVLNSLSNAN